MQFVLQGDKGSQKFIPEPLNPIQSNILQQEVSAL